MQLLIKFFDWLESHNAESDYKIAKNFISQSTTNCNSHDTEELKYENFLTNYAFTKIKSNFERYKHINFTAIDYNNQCASLHCKGNVLNVSTISCECEFFLRNNLPCHHIFGVRYIFNEPIFDEKLCDKRWTRHYLKINNRSLESLVNNNSPSDEVRTPNSMDNIFISRTRKTKSKTVSEKRKILQPLLSELSNVVSMNCGEKFENKLKIIQLMIDTWKDNKEIVLCETDYDMKHLESSIESLDIDERNTHKIDCIKLPKVCKIKGRPAEFLKTTPLRSKSKQ